MSLTCPLAAWSPPSAPFTAGLPFSKEVGSRRVLASRAGKGVKEDGRGIVNEVIGLLNGRVLLLFLPTLRDASW